MTKTDKKLISLTLIIAMVFTIFSPVIVNAAENVPEGAIEFKDQVLFEKLKTATVFDEELNKYVPVDKNEDGYITKQEMEDLESLTVYVYSNDEKITSLEDLAYKKNIKSLTVTGIDESVAEYDLTPFTNVESNFNVAPFVSNAIFVTFLSIVKFELCHLLIEWLCSYKSLFYTIACYQYSCLS